MRTRTLVIAVAVTSACLVTGGIAPAAIAAPTTGPETAAANAPAQQAKAPAKNAADFNRDGYRDLVITVPMYSSPTDRVYAAGAVVVLYGSARGVTPADRQIITQATPGVPGASERSDYFGHQAVAEDYDGDGYADLAVSKTGEDMTIGDMFHHNAGQISIIWGGRKGLTQHGATTVRQTAPIGADVRRGASLAAGDFNGDGRADLATGDYSQGRGGEVLYGPITRAGKPKSAISLGLRDGQTYVHTALDSGDVTGDGITDLVVQVYPGRTGPVSRIEIHRGTRKGLIRTGNLKDAQGQPLINRSATDGHVAVGDLDKDGHADIVVGEEWAQGATGHYTGKFTVVHGGKNGQDTGRTPQVFTQDTEGVPDTAEKDDYFGASVSVGDINGDGYADVAAGAPVEDVGALSHSGTVTTFLGGPGGLTGRGAKVYDQDTAGVPGIGHDGDRFGAALGLTDLNGDRRADLVVGSPGEDSERGAVSVLPGSPKGTTGLGAKTFGPTDLGLPNSMEAGFGESFGG